MEQTQIIKEQTQNTSPTQSTPPLLLPNELQPLPKERLAYSIQEAADMLGLNYFSVYRLIQRDKLKVCRVLRGKFLIARTELLKLLASE